jgi:hypothetical protein
MSRTEREPNLDFFTRPIKLDEGEIMLPKNYGGIWWEEIPQVTRVELIEKAAIAFIATGFKFTAGELEKRKLAFISNTIHKYYPGQFSQLKENLNKKTFQNDKELFPRDSHGNIWWEKIPEEDRNELIEKAAIAFIATGFNLANKDLRERGLSYFLSAIRKYYPGQMIGLKEKLEISIKKRKGYWTEEIISAALISEMDELGHFPTSEELKERNGPLLSAMVREPRGYSLWKEKMGFQNDVHAPEGWLTCGKIAKQIGVRHRFANQIADKLRDTHPEFFRFYLDKSGKRSEHYSPELVAIINQELQLRPDEVPEGWIAINSLARQHKSTGKFISKVAERYRSSNPEWFQVFRNRGRLFEYYSPELSAIILRDLSQYTNPPEGWVNNRSLAKQLGKSEKFIRTKGERHRAEHPEWFQIFRENGSASREYYSPELVSLLENESLRYSSAPEGWNTNNGIARQLGISARRIAKIVNEFRDSHPNFFDYYLDNVGKRCEHYSPELIKEITFLIMADPNRISQNKAQKDLWKLLETEK